MGHLGLQTWSHSPRVYLSVEDLRNYLMVLHTASSVTISVGQKFFSGSLSECVFFRGVGVEESQLGLGVDLREVEEFHQLCGCCVPPWSQQCLPDQGTSGKSQG